MIRAAYLRVSTEDQNLDLQESLLKAQKPDRIYSDKDSGSNVSRKAYTELCKDIQGGIIREVWVSRLDRLGRDPRELIRFFDLLDVHQVKFISLTEPWLTDWNMGPMQFLTWWLQIGMARFELLLLKDRQRRGIAAARARGQHMGRPKGKILKEKCNCITIRDQERTNVFLRICTPQGIACYFLTAAPAAHMAIWDIAQIRSEILTQM